MFTNLSIVNFSASMFEAGKCFVFISTMKNMKKLLIFCDTVAYGLQGHTIHEDKNAQKSISRIAAWYYLTNKEA